jgi:phenylalanyl-tRNA synthetase beta chain
MKVSLDWLSDHLDISGYSQEELDALLTFAGIEVEGIEAMPDKVVVAEIKSTEKHPDADKLSVCMVDDGSDALRQIVCGAKNYKVGDKVALALPGSVLGPDFKIKSGKLRGIESHGMLCSGSELGRADDSGLWILPEDAKPGTPLGEMFPAVFDLEITPNRPDCLSHLGVARELAALSGRELKGEACHLNPSVSHKAATPVQVAIIATDRCPLYTARRIRGIKVAESPAWLKDKLESIGLRPINNIVDITNYVLMEMGQPLHAFDAAKLDGGIVVRMAEDSEKFVALDGETYQLDRDDLVIADSAKAVAIAGIMGGEGSGVTDGTTEVLLESAYFTPAAIRRSGRKLGLASDSSYRFERGIDPAQVAGASELATKLILELAGGTADDEILVCGDTPAPPSDANFDSDRCRRLLGHDVPDEEMHSILEKLGLEKSSSAGSASTWTPPTFRGDLSRPADLYEEVARVYGLDRIPARCIARFSEVSDADLAHDFSNRIADRLAALGYYETRTIKLTSRARLTDNVCLHDNQPVALKNPLSDDLTHLRPGLVAALLDVAERNIHQGAETLRLFEVGTVFSSAGKKGETQNLALLVSGPDQGSWQNPRPEAADFFTLRGALDAITTPLQLRIAPSEDAPDGAAVVADILLGKLRIGRAAQIAPARARAMDARHPVFVAEFDLGLLQMKSTRKPGYVELPKFPAITRDVAIEAPRDFANGSIETVLTKLQSPLLESFKLFDLFSDDSGEKLDASKKSLAYSLTYRGQTRTLESSEVDKAHAEVLAELKAKLPVEFR